MYLIVDDDRHVSRALAARLEADLEAHCILETTFESGFAQIEASSRLDGAVFDLVLPGGDASKRLEALDLWRLWTL
jgi:DNA-binding NarL/FixJ family response regulator